MKASLYPADWNCPCGSGRNAQDCCIPTDPPVSVPPDQWKNLKLEVEAVDRLSVRHDIEPNDELNVKITFNHPSQLDPEIEELFDWVVESIEAPPRVINVREWRSEAMCLFENVISQMYGLRYRQRQFFARLRKVTSYQAFSSPGPSGPLEARFNDRPLRHELEGYLIRLIAMRDPLGKFGSFLLGRSPDGFGAFCQHIEQSQALDPLSKKKVTEAIRGLDWMKEARNLRNAVVHEGKFQGFRGVGRRGDLLLDAQLGDHRAGAFCLRTWKQMTEFTEIVAKNIIGSIDD